ncbi:DUF3667 domain-containing protein [Aurantiacibacter spongiae]|uniref:DUF3667 domain-containing protein n=1 Tax=Aurantiacibacter spongiae TaxID=2488860 RepID=UPI00268B9176|nr:DUF3667 domain-containing protein [Aurantiacibacter spongiae]
MSDLFDGIGTAAQGGLLARALDPDSGAKRPHPHQPEACLNCGTELTGAYCRACGQQGHVHRTIGAFMHDLLHGALHFEGKLWRTLPMLALKPGSLTRRYIDGERARFVSPMALFLFAVFLMFAIFQMAGLTAPTDLEGRISPEAGLASVERQLEARRDAAQAQLDEMPADDPQRAATEAAIEQVEDDLDGLWQNRRYVVDDERSFINFGTDGTGIPLIDKLAKKWNDNPGLMLYKFQANSYKFSWLLIPISIPFV